MFYYMNEAVWAYQNMFITYYNENWDYSQKMLAKSLKEITKKCFRKLKDTKMYDFDRFSPLPFKKEKKTGLFRKSVFLHLGLSVDCNGLVWKRRWSILAELCYYKEKRKMSLSVFHQTTSCLSQYCTCYHLISPPSVKKKKKLYQCRICIQFQSQIWFDAVYMQAFKRCLHSWHMTHIKCIAMLFRHEAVHKTWMMPLYIKYS